MRLHGSWIYAVAALHLSGTVHSACLPKYFKPSSVNSSSDSGSGIFSITSAMEGKVGLPSCKLERKTTTMPTPPGGYSSSFSQPEANLEISGVYFGHGTQNYTCADENSVPKAVGAKAQLVDMSCIVKQAPEAAHRLPREYMDGKREFFYGLITVFAVSGEHYFPDASTPVFTFGDDDEKLFVGKKKDNVPSPAAEDDIGENGTVDWLNLDVTEDAIGFKRAYRVMTAGGKPPATCKGMEKSFEVPYATEYWFWSEK